MRDRPQFYTNLFDFAGYWTAFGGGVPGNNPRPDLRWEGAGNEVNPRLEISRQAETQRDPDLIPPMAAGVKDQFDPARDPQFSRDPIQVNSDRVLPYIEALSDFAIL
jgi:hypothetical protein